MPVMTNLRGQRRIRKSLGQVWPAGKEPKKDPDQASSKSLARRMPRHREEQSRGQPTHADVEPPGSQHVPKRGSGTVIVSVGVAFDGHPDPSSNALGARDHGDLVTLRLERSGEIPQVSPWLQVQLGRRERFRDHPNPKGFQEPTRASDSADNGSRRGWDSPE